MTPNISNQISIAAKNMESNRKQYETIMTLVL